MAQNDLSHSNPPALTSKIAGITGMSYYAWLFLIQRNVFRVVQKSEKALSIKLLDILNKEEWV